MGGAKTQVMLCGIPNVGKSTLINTFAGSARATAADRPGVPKGKQWVSTEKFDLLDMPGVLWKKFDSKTIASNLAFIGSIKDDILDVEELAMNLLDVFFCFFPVYFFLRVSTQLYFLFPYISFPSFKLNFLYILFNCFNCFTLLIFAISFLRIFAILCS